MIRLLLVRHGRTEWNRLGRVQGHTDVHLDEVGRDQATVVAPVLAGYSPVAIWSSDLSRAADTAERIALAAGVAVHRDARLRERSFGDVEGLTHAEFEARSPVDFAAFRVGDFDQVASAEPSDVVAARMVACVDEMLAGMRPGETGVVVAHGAALKVLVGSLIGLYPHTAVATLVGMDNCGWAEVHLEKVDGAWVGRLVGYNRVAH